MGRKNMIDTPVDKHSAHNPSDDTSQTQQPANFISVNSNYKEQYGFNVPEQFVYKAQKGLNEQVVGQISAIKDEPQWMRDFRLHSLQTFFEKKMPDWGADLSGINFDDIYYYLRPTDHAEKTWDDVPEQMKNTFERLGVPQAEREFLAGVKAQFDSEIIYGSLQKELDDQGVIFMGTDEALKKHPEFFEQYFSKVIPPADNKFAALNSAVWSGGSFVYVPKGVKVKRPLQAYFRINAKDFGQFERTLIIIDEGAEAHYVEGCFTAGQRVTTKNGFKNIEEIIEGDEVLTHKGFFKKVYNTQKRDYSGVLYKIKLASNSEVIECTEEHPFLIQNLEGKYEWRVALELTVNTKLVVPNSLYEVFTTQVVETIEKVNVEKVDVFNFSVEEDESYVVGGVAVHNCTAPVYSSNSLHSAVVEVIVKKNARFRYTTIQNWSSNVYNLVTKRARVEENAVMEWVDGNLGCLSGDTDVFLENGVKKIKDVKVGDKVLSLNSEMQITSNQVTATKSNTPLKTFEIKTLNQRAVQATDNHPFLVWKKIGELNYLSWMPLSAINIGDHIALSGLVPNVSTSKDIEFENEKPGKPIKIPTKTSVDLMWLFGFYIGDGFVDGTRMGFAVPEVDKSYSLVKSIIENMFGVQTKQRLNVLQVNSKNFVQFFKKMSFEGNAYTKRIPSWVFELPIAEKKAFIDGYIAADGHFRENHKNVSITSVNLELLEQVRLLAYMCGLNPTKISKWTRKEKKKLGKEEKVYTHYFLYFGNELLHDPCIFSRVISIEELGEQVTYDIEVEKDSNFIANGVFVHNSKVTMKYPSCYLVGNGARGEVLSIAYAGHGQHQDAGAKMVHLAPNTSSLIVSKSVSANAGRTSYRGLVHVSPTAKNAKSRVECDALILDQDSASDTFPVMKIDESSANIEHEATVSKIGEEKIFYLMSHGLTEAQAMGLIVSGFIEPIVKQLPLEYAVELNRLIELEMEGSVG